MARPPAVLHHVKSFQSPGGIRSILRQHLDNAGEDARLAAFMDAGAAPDRKVIPLAGRPNSRISAMRRAYRQRVAGFSPMVSIYHNCWGMDWLADLDPAPARLGFLHSNLPRFRRFVRCFSRHADGFITINEQLLEKTRQCFKKGAEPWIRLLPSPVTPPSWALRQRAFPRDRTVIGFSGRLESVQKRVDRLPALLDWLDRHLPGYEFEILGTGPDEPILREIFRNRPNVTFHGWIEGEDYWRILSRWKYIIFVSRYEGLPISLLEALACGVIPLYPDFHEGKDFPARIDPALLYPPGQPDALGQAILNAEKWDTEHLRAFHERSAAALPDHLHGGYQKAFTALLDAPLPPPARRRVSLARHAPVWLYNRLCKVLSG